MPTYAYIVLEVTVIILVCGYNEALSWSHLVECRNLDCPSTGVCYWKKQGALITLLSCLYVVCGVGNTCQPEMGLDKSLQGMNRVMIIFYLFSKWAKQYGTFCDLVISVHEIISKTTDGYFCGIKLVWC